MHTRRVFANQGYINYSDYNYTLKDRQNCRKLFPKIKHAHYPDIDGETKDIDCESIEDALRYTGLYGHVRDKNRFKNREYDDYKYKRIYGDEKSVFVLNNYSNDSAEFDFHIHDDPTIRLKMANNCSDNESKKEPFYIHQQNSNPYFCYPLQNSTLQVENNIPQSTNNPITFYKQILSDPSFCLHVISDASFCFQVLSNTSFCYKILSEPNLSHEVLSNQSFCIQVLNTLDCAQQDINDINYHFSYQIRSEPRFCHQILSDPSFCEEVLLDVCFCFQILSNAKFCYQILSDPSVCKNIISNPSVSFQKYAHYNHLSKPNYEHPFTNPNYAHPFTNPNYAHPFTNPNYAHQIPHHNVLPQHNNQFFCYQMPNNTPTQIYQPIIIPSSDYKNKCDCTSLEKYRSNRYTKNCFGISCCIPCGKGRCCGCC